jgi:DNA modification methylase
MFVKAQKGNQVLVHGDSSLIQFKRSFDLIVTSPPYFHPAKKNPSYGFSPDTRKLEAYSEYTVSVLLKSLEGLKAGKLLCLVKTDAWHKGRLIPIGYSLANECLHQGLTLHAHWIWEKMPYYSPYSPSFANVFIFGQPPLRRIPFQGIITDAHLKKKKSRLCSFTPEIFEFLLRLLSNPGDTVLDPFVGTGSVIEAAARTGRWAMGIEICAKQIAVARMQLANRQLSVHDRTNLNSR